MNMCQHIWIISATNKFGRLTRHALVHRILRESRFSFRHPFQGERAWSFSLSTIFPSPRLTRACRTWFPLPSVEMTRPMRQSWRFIISLTIITRFPSFKSLLVERHFERAWRRDRYFQKQLILYWAYFQVWRWILSSPMFPGMMVADEWEKVAG